jgi:hypothetical protein
MNCEVHGRRRVWSDLPRHLLGTEQVGSAGNTSDFYLGDDRFEPRDFLQSLQSPLPTTSFSIQR